MRIVACILLLSLNITVSYSSVLNNIEIEYGMEPHHGLDKAEKLYLKALNCESRGKYQKALKYYLKSADLGYNKAQYDLGVKFHKGIGVLQSDLLALKWYTVAAENGHVEAKYVLGELYIDGDVVHKDPVKAVEWYKDAANHGYVMAQMALAELYENGEDVQQDYNEALKWYDFALVSGASDISLSIDRVLKKRKEKAEELYEKAVLCEKLNKNEAETFYLKAADYGHLYSQKKIAKIYFDRNDFKESFKWYHKAALQGDAFAQGWVGYFYHCGKGVEENLHEAVFWYRKAAEQGSDYSRCQFASICVSWSGKEKQEAIKYLRQAVGNNYPYAEYLLGKCYEDGTGVGVNETEAFSLFLKAARMGEGRAYEELAECYERGYGVTQDLNNALYWYQKCVDWRREEGLNLYGYDKKIKELNTSIEAFRKGEKAEQELIANSESVQTASNYTIYECSSEIDSETLLDAIKHRYRGRNILILIWSRECSPAMSAIKWLETIKTKLAHKDIVYVNISDDSEDVSKVINRYNLSGEFYATSRGIGEILWYGFSKKTYPYFVYFDKKGNAICDYCGFALVSKIEREFIEKIINK